MAKRRSGFFKRFLTLSAVLVLAGLHQRPRTTNTSRTTDTPNNDADGGGRPGRTHANSDAPVSTQQEDLTTSAKGPGRPAAHRPIPEDNTRTTEDGNTIVHDPDREKPEVDHTSGYGKDLPKPYQDRDGVWHIHLRMHEGWDQGDFDAKSQHLQKLGEDGELTYSKAPKRSSNTSTWRDEMEREIFWTSKDQEEYNTRIAELDSQQIDHAQDLQLGGPDEKDNMWGIDSTTNHGMGGQIYSQLRKLKGLEAEYGEPVKIDIVPGVYSPPS